MQYAIDTATGQSVYAGDIVVPSHESKPMATLYSMKKGYGDSCLYAMVDASGGLLGWCWRVYVGGKDLGMIHALTGDRVSFGDIMRWSNSEDWDQLAHFFEFPVLDVVPL